jgi:hypothetical protein
MCRAAHEAAEPPQDRSVMRTTLNSSRTCRQLKRDCSSANQAVVNQAPGLVVQMGGSLTVPFTACCFSFANAACSKARSPYVETSVVDPDSYIFGPPGSGSVIILFGSDSFHRQAKKVKKNLDFYQCCGSGSESGSFFLVLLNPDPDPLDRGMDPDPDPALEPDANPSIIKQI